MTDVSQPPVQVNWTLVVDDGSNATKVFPVTRDSLTIGRAITADIRLDDAHISRHHARLTRQGELLLVEDLNTVNGTFVNGQPITTLYALQAGDLISFGSFTIKVEKSVVPVTPSQTVTHAYAPSEAKPQIGWIFLIAAGLAGLILIVLLGVGVYWIAFRPEASSLTANNAPQGPKIIINQAPATNNPIPINQMVTVQALASDPTGVTRLELWVNGRKVDEVDTQLVQVASSLNAALQWTPNLPGVHALEVRAYNESGVVNIQLIGNFRVVGEPGAPTPVPFPSPPIVSLLPNVTPPPAAAEQPTPTLIPPLPTSVRPTPTLIPPIPTSVIPPTPLPGQPFLTVNIPTITVRTGPSTQYNPVGQLVQGTRVEVVGVANVGQGQWWQIPFEAAPGGLGWVSGNPASVSASNTAIVPVVNVPPRPTVAIAAASSTSFVSTSVPPTDTLAPTTTATPAESLIIRAPAGKTLLIVGNRSLDNQPALLTLSEGKSVGGGRQIDTPAGKEVELLLEPDLYRAMWSSPARRGGFVRSADFIATADKVIVMWIVPEDGVTDIEVYDQLITAAGEAATAEPATPTSAPVISGYTAPFGKALFIAANRSLNNSYSVVTLSGGSFGGGKEVKLDAGVEIPLELLPGNYRAVWSSPARRGGFTAGRDFQVSTGEVIISWIVPEAGNVFIQFPGQVPLQINN